ncbi:hypothetical protein OG204_17050 [Streptomyces sp. NBC_01387]|uniref:hypothetical protein n=1 Tax=unclassified Streptomyces TaxID=2593676 RepID=UPI002023C740|nr:MULTISPECIES: hypothetical protein [unclassified Streptomyces]MCX4549930.1 hypothetical protein [Streptomyces sp. NBC_01500]WSC21445.1 hypothetical protein OIE60_18140 [Streptomyces sp. NBC_01766]WSV55383.1 hypothetical protein OG282_17705 [Streptomyces sp. NBC_01014]
MSENKRFGRYGRDGRAGRDGRGSRDGLDWPEEWDKQYGGPVGPVNNQAGNGMPNEGPDNAVDGLDEDELALRRLMRGAVQDLTPSEDALDHLRRAVPARRARRRQVVVGSAAAALLVCTAIPAFIHVAASGGGVEKHAAVAGPGHHTPGSKGSGPDDDDGSPRKKGTASGGDGEKDKDGAKGRTQGSGTDSDDGTKGGTKGPPNRALADLPTCTAGQLGISHAATGSPDADGTVYGTFRVSNVSDSQCAVSDAGTVNFQALGAADAARITVVDHTAGDAANGLPDPSQETTGLVLDPSQAYEVKFAWVPAETCPTGNTSPTPTPTGGGGGTSGSTSGGSVPSSGNTASGVGPQLAREDGGTSDGSVAVVHEAEPGVPAAEATIPNACAGTIYRTGLLSAP